MLQKLEIDFLHRLNSGAGADVCISREEDRARQKMRRKGYAEFDRGTWQWTITPAGMLALRQNEMRRT